MSSSYADEASRRINDKLESIIALLKLAESNFSEIDPKSSDFPKLSDQLIMSILESTPYAHCLWLCYEAGVVNPDERYIRSYIYEDNIFTEVFDVNNELLDTPGKAEWYHKPLKTGRVHLENIKYYDYGPEGGSVYIGTITYPVRYNGELIGCVGIDILSDKIFSFLDAKQVKDVQNVLLVSESGDILYSTDTKLKQLKLQDLSFHNTQNIIDKMQSNTPFWLQEYSPLSEEESVMYFEPVSSVFTSEQLYLYVDLTTNHLYSAARNSLRSIVITSLIGFGLLFVSLFLVTKSILEPIKKLTKSANMMADGYLDQSLELSGVSENTKNEVDMLYLALKKMLNQMNEIHSLKVEAIRSRYDKEKAEESSRAKSDFLAKMSHEIRTPMNAIVGMSELIMREDIPPQIYEHVINIKQSSANLLSIINDILDFSKIESGKFELVETGYLFSSLISDVISIIRIRITDKQILFVTNIDSNIPNNLIGDEIRVRQVMLNLLNNAVKYTSEGFIRVTIEGRIEDDKIYLTIKVSDSGIGIKEENIDKLFEDFIQVDMHKNKNIEGTGLGLPITKILCDNLGGSLSVESEYGKGSTFTAVLPQKIADTEKLAVVEHPNKNVLLYETRQVYAESIKYTLDNLRVPYTCVHRQSDFHEELKESKYDFLFVSSFFLEGAKGIKDRLCPEAQLVLLSEFGEIISAPDIRVITMPAHSISIANVLNDVEDMAVYSEKHSIDIKFMAPSAKILIVDDIKTNLNVAKGLMAPYDMHINTCLSGAEAIELVKRNEYDIVFMDHMMPEMDGIETTEAIRNLEDGTGYFKNLPIIALTANAVSGMKELFLENDMNDFLAKPIEITKLHSILEKWIPKDKKVKYKKKKVEEPLAVSFEIEGINVQNGIMMTGGTIDNYIKTLTVFYQDGLEKLDQIRDTHKRKEDIYLFATLVHALKSASASIGAQKLSEMAKDLEFAGKREDTVFLDNNVEIFCEELELTLKNINKTVVKEPEESVDSKEADMDFLKEQFLVLKDALENMEIGIMDQVMKVINKHQWDTLVTNIINSLSNYILVCEYDEAVELIDSYLAQP